LASFRKLVRRLNRAIYAYRTGYQDTGERVNPDFPDKNFANHLRFYQFASQFVGGKNVLDCGCGTGYGTALFADSGANTALGIDLSGDAIGFATSRFVRPNLSFRVMDAQQFALPNAEFDMVYSSENLEHLPNPEANLAEIRRVLRPGGMLVLGTPNKEMSSPGSEPHNPYHVREFYFEELQAQLAAHFAHVHIFENTADSGEPLGRRLKAERVARSAIGIRTQGQSCVVLDGLPVDLTHMHNTHSFVCLCW
jgi:ubiquinone/menaquinone biosynthesis C-methylase UbiE